MKRGQNRQPAFQEPPIRFPSLRRLTKRHMCANFSTRRRRRVQGGIPLLKVEDNARPESLLSVAAARPTSPHTAQLSFIRADALNRNMKPRPC
jgi:hypothetical protein